MLHFFNTMPTKSSKRWNEKFFICSHCSHSLLYKLKYILPTNKALYLLFKQLLFDRFEQFTSDNLTLKTIDKKKSQFFYWGQLVNHPNIEIIDCEISMFLYYWQCFAYSVQWSTQMQNIVLCSWYSNNHP